MVAVVEVLSPLRVWSAADGSDHQEYFSVRIDELVAGSQKKVVVGNRLDVFAHAEGEPRIRSGERMLLFLEATAEHAELSALATRFPFFTLQGAGDEWKVADDVSDLVEIARAWRELAASEKGDCGLVQRQMLSADPRLRADAITHLPALARRSDVPRDCLAALRAMVSGDRLRVVERLALIHALAANSADEILALSEEDLSAEDRRALIRASGRLRDPRVARWLVAQVGADDRESRIAALHALGFPWHDAHVEAVAAASRADDLRTRQAAVRALGGMATPAAAAVLRDLAVSGTGGVGGLAKAALLRIESGARRLDAAGAVPIGN